jgi:hypothetical protein
LDTIAFRNVGRYTLEVDAVVIVDVMVNDNENNIFVSVALTVMLRDR